eukprot:12834120-Heterocapsa_arctica.AAC.1
MPTLSHSILKLLLASASAAIHARTTGPIFSPPLLAFADERRLCYHVGNRDDDHPEGGGVL